METNIRLKRLDSDCNEAVFAGIKSDLVAELKGVKAEIEQTRIVIKELGNQKKWLDWIQKIGVQLDKETNDHRLDITFRMGLVGDGIQYADTRNKSAGHDVVAGTMGAEIVISKEEMQRRHTEKRTSGRWHPKKKQRED